MNISNLNISIIALIFNLIDVICVILPVLLAVAFMTIIERKQLAALQRRVGPDTVGQKIKRLKTLPKKLGGRTYHTSSIIYNKNIDKTAIEELYKNRVSPVTKFDSNIISTCSNLLNSTERSLFLKE